MYSLNYKHNIIFIHLLQYISTLHQYNKPWQANQFSFRIGLKSPLKIHSKVICANSHWVPGNDALVWGIFVEHWPKNRPLIEGASVKKNSKLAHPQYPGKLQYPRKSPQDRTDSCILVCQDTVLKLSHEERMSFCRSLPWRQVWL